MLGGSLGANILPDWYFVWTDIVLRASFFSNQYVLDGLLTMVGVILLLTLIPWVDRSPARHPAQRPLISILFIALIGELFALTVYGYLTTTALEIASAGEIFEVFVFVPLTIVLLGMVIYRFSPAYVVNKGKLWAIKPEWDYAGIKQEVEAAEALVSTNLYRGEAGADLGGKLKSNPEDKPA
ncbi:hypothetical protein B9Q04_18480 [Candidatus Marsarchaeota G2 archaeon BE_D]|uniref:Cytochrome b/b6 C-terminal region profile domain-containing protein n=1 Tax=Candidatus Marsarchaeota G2 archaeon BE_D TaxID=1978158 RepID=A0A2R6C4X9_9ARCH|nr:MAG: hypothetical protein B9Q04_18480 [Candidatus Marsarchaeota G2 archaeon BE_D]